MMSKASKVSYEKIAATLLGISLAALMQGCLQSPGDAAQGEMNRETQYANTIADQYAQMKGQFAGTLNDSAVLLTLDVAMQNSQGNGDLGLSPQPTLVGSLDLTPPVFTENSTDTPFMIPFSITGGQYVDGNDLTLTIQEGGGPTVAHCAVTRLDVLDCNWYVNASTAPVAQFELKRVTNGQGLSVDPKHYEGEYVGSNADYKNIQAEFETELDLQNGSSSIPQVSVGGSFIMDGVNFVFKDGEYDPISNTLVVNIAGTNPITVDCLVKNQSSLHCVWHGTHGVNSREEFDLTQEN